MEKIKKERKKNKKRKTYKIESITYCWARAKGV